MALAATTVLVLGTVTLRVRLTPWTVTTVEGDVRIGGQVAGSTAPVQDGQLIETAERSKALLQVGIIGQVEIDEGSRLRIVTTNRREHRLGLERGRISAVISAPPRWFTVDTPAAAAIDLGCAYTLEVDQAGFGTLRVQEGWVQLDWGANEDIVPEQAMTHMRTGRGPGSPMPATDSERRCRLSTSDAMTKCSLPCRLYWPSRAHATASPCSHSGVGSEASVGASVGRGQVYDRLAVFLPPPPDVTRARIGFGS